MLDTLIWFENVIGKTVCPPNETLLGDQCVHTLKIRVEGSFENELENESKKWKQKV